MVKLMKIVKLFCLLCFFGCVVGCCVNSKSVAIKNDPAVVLSHRLSDFIVKMPHFAKDEMILKIPTSQLFNPSSANFTDNGKSILSNLAALMKLYEKEDVCVIGYISLSKGIDPVFAKSLANEQAQKVIDYLWKKHADMRITSGSGHLLQPRNTAYNLSRIVYDGNYVEIHFHVFARQ